MSPFGRDELKIDPSCEDNHHYSPDYPPRRHFFPDDDDDDDIEEKKGLLRSNDSRQTLQIRTEFFLICVGFFLLVIGFVCWMTSTTKMTSTLFRKEPDNATNRHQDSTSTTRGSKNMIQELGWIETVQYFQQELGKESNALKKRVARPKQHKSKYTITIDSLYDTVSLALDTVGMRGVVYEVFNQNLEYYHLDNVRNDLSSCNRDHGVGCPMNTIWWLNHYVGAIMADKILHEGKLLLDGSRTDPTNNNYIHNAVEFMTELHRLQEHVYVPNDNSFHMSHGFVWHYVVSTKPDLMEYPVELSQQFCSPFLQHNQHAKGQTPKWIGSECFHSFGHAIFAVVAHRQEQREQQSDDTTTQAAFSARVQYIPMSGFRLSDKAICEAYQICYTAPVTDESRSPQKYCHGGFKHSQQLLSKTLKDPHVRDLFFAKKFQQCEKKLGLPPTFTISPSVAPVEKEDSYYY